MLIFRSDLFLTALNWNLLTLTILINFGEFWSEVDDSYSSALCFCRYDSFFNSIAIWWYSRLKEYLTKPIQTCLSYIWIFSRKSFSCLSSITFFHHIGICWICVSEELTYKLPQQSGNMKLIQDRIEHYRGK